MIFDLGEHNDYDKHIHPFTKNGVFIDTSVLLIFIDGFIETRYSKRVNSDFNTLEKFLDLIKMRGHWKKFLITPHVLTETLSHINVGHNRQPRYKEIVAELFPVLNEMCEKMVEKSHMLESVDFDNPVLEAGDISIYIGTKDCTDSSQKTSILCQDWEISGKYKNDPSVMVWDFHSIKYMGL